MISTSPLFKEFGVLIPASGRRDILDLAPEDIHGLIADSGAVLPRGFEISQQSPHTRFKMAA